MNSFQTFNSKILHVLEDFKQKDIIIYGGKGSYLQWLLKENGFNIAYIIDRWETSEYAHVNHLMTLYYLDEDKLDDYVIINSVPRTIGVKNSFIDIGEQWDKTAAKVPYYAFYMKMDMKSWEESSILQKYMTWEKVI